MLIAVQTSGNKPPLFLVHELRDIVPLARALGVALGPDQPFYAIDANPATGREPPVHACCEEIRRVRPSGPLRLGGMREGILPALGIARTLLQQRRQIGPLILIDPPPLAAREAVPVPFPDPTEVILTRRGATAFFHPQLPWQKLLCGPRIVHVLPWEHEDLFRAGREDVAHVLHFISEQVPTFEALAQGPKERSAA
jgi:thioesterase domain-containing protein